MKRMLISIVMCLVLAGVANAANEVKVPYATGQTLFFVIKNTSNQTWDPANNNWETATGAITDYDIALTEDAVITGTYAGSIDTDITDAYDLIAVIYISGGTSPIGTQAIPWSGSAALNTSGSVQVGLTAQGFTAARAVHLDNINNAALATTVAQTGDAFARLGAPAGASVSADVAAIKADTSSLGSAVSYKSAIAAGTHTASTFTLSTGPTGTSYFTGRYWWVTVVDATDGVPGGGIISNYDGATKTVTIEVGLPFTPAEGDEVYIMPMAAQPKWSR